MAGRPTKDSARFKNCKRGVRYEKNSSAKEERTPQLYKRNDDGNKGLDKRGQHVNSLNGSVDKENKQRPSRSFTPVVVDKGYRSSRLVLTGFPPFVDSKKLRAFLLEAKTPSSVASALGSMTDCIVKFTKEGKNRQIAFLGLKTEREAEIVKSYFDKTFIYTRKVKVDFSLPRSARPPRENKTTETADESKFAKDDGRANMCTEVQSVDNCGNLVKKVSVKNAKAGVSTERTHAIFADDEGSTLVEERKDIKYVDFGGFEASNDETDDISWLRGKSEASKDVTELNEKSKQAEIIIGQQSNDYAPDRVTQDNGSKADNAQNVDKKDGSPSTKGSSTEFQLSESRIFLQNLAYDCQLEDVKGLCCHFGEVAEVFMIKDKDTGKFKGQAFVAYVFPEHAAAALSKLDGLTYQGRILKAVTAYEKPVKSERKWQYGVQPKTSYQRQKLQQRQTKIKEDEEMQDTRLWNLLYVSANSTASAVELEMGVSKSALLDVTGESAAAQLAIAEVHVLKATEQWVKNEGINPEAFQRRGKDLLTAEYKCTGEIDQNSEKIYEKNINDKPALCRAADTLIIKHLPAGNVDLQELMNMFSRFGTLGRFLISPSKTVAIAQYLNSNSADAALYGLAYRPYKTVPLYIEKAPVPVFKEDIVINQQAEAAGEEALRSQGLFGKIADGKATEDRKDHKIDSTVREGERRNERLDSKNKDDGTAERKNQRETAVDTAEGEGLDIDEVVAAGTSLFIKNINFKTTEETLDDVFRVCEGHLKTRIMTKKRAIPGGGVEVLSAGYAFISFESLESAVNAAKKMQGTMVDGHLLNISVSKCTSLRSASGGPLVRKKAAGGGSAGTKLIVKNLAFEASEKDLRKLFSTFGAVCRVTIPKNVGGRSRGFAFAQFASKADAVGAMEALANAHLYGRHLVLEFAQDGTGSVFDSTKLMDMLNSNPSSSEFKAGEPGARTETSRPKRKNKQHFKDSTKQRKTSAHT